MSSLTQLEQQFKDLLNELNLVEKELAQETEKNKKLQNEFEELRNVKAAQQQQEEEEEDPFNSPFSPPSSSHGVEEDGGAQDIFSDEYEVDDSWLSQHLDPFNNYIYQSAVLNPALALFESLEDDDDDHRGGTSGNFGSLDGLKKTWALSVDEAVLKSVSNEERKRQEAIFEFISTERHYVTALQTILELFYTPIRTERLMKSSEVASIFMNIESLLVCHVKILSDLEQVQRRDKLFVKILGRHFLKHVEIIKLDASEKVSADDRVTSVLGYLEYCSNQMAASKLLQNRRSSDPKLAEFLKSAQLSERGRSLDLSSYLLEPMQRITRYPLLLKQILHYTPKDHSDQPCLLECLRLTEHLLSMVNMAAKEAESRAQLVELNKVIKWESFAKDGTFQDFKLDLTSQTRFHNSRILLYDGLLFKAKSGKKLHVFLFNDMLLLTQPIKEGEMKYRMYRQPLLLTDLMLRQRSSSSKQPVSAADKDLSIDLAHGKDMVSLRAPDAKLKKTWMQKIQEAITVTYKAQEDLTAPSKKEKQLADKSNCIGTINLLILECQNLDVPQLGEHVNVETAVYLRASVAEQHGTTPHKAIFSRSSIKFSTPMLFSILSIDESLKFKIYASDKYSKDEIIGECDIQLDFLEYYGGKDTEIITLQVKRLDHKSVGKLLIKLSYRAQI